MWGYKYVPVWITHTDNGAIHRGYFFWLNGGRQKGKLHEDSPCDCKVVHGEENADKIL